MTRSSLIAPLLLCWLLLSASASANDTARWHVIDRQTIDAYDFRFVSDALALVPGFTTVRTHLLRDIPTARGVLQFHYANRILVTINGVPAWHATTGEGSLNRVNIEHVERIEVMAGPASVTYGSQAYAGVINLVLRTAPGAAAYAGAGVPAAFDAGLRVAASGPSASWLVAGSLADADGRRLSFTDEAGIGGLVDQSTRGASLTFAGTFEAGGTHRVMANGIDASETFFGTTPTFAQGAGHPHDSRGLVVSYGWVRPLTERLAVDARVSHDHGLREFARSRDAEVISRVEGRRLAGSMQLTASVTDTSSLHAGVDVDARRSVEYDNLNIRTGTVLADNNMRDREVGERSAFAVYRHTVDRLDIDAGVRLTDNDNFGAHTALSGAIGYRLRPRHAVRLRGAQSYRSPSLFELYFETAERTVFGNLALAPETSDMAEVEYAGRFGRVDVRASAFRAEYDDQILRARRAPADPSDLSLMYVNGASFASTGFELSARAQGAFVTYGYVRGDDAEESPSNPAALFRFVPDHALALGASRAFGPLTASGVVEYRSSVIGPGRAPARIDGQERVTLSLAYRHRSGSTLVTHGVSLRNLTGSPQATPEYVRQNINHLPDSFGRAAIYRIEVAF